MRSQLARLGLVVARRRRLCLCQLRVRASRSCGSLGFMSFPNTRTYISSKFISTHHHLQWRQVGLGRTTRRCRWTAARLHMTSATWMTPGTPSSVSVGLSDGSRWTQVSWSRRLRDSSSSCTSYHLTDRSNPFRANRSSSTIPDASKACSHHRLRAARLTR